MLINSVKLSNIRSYLDESIVFPRGSVLLSGDIGSGKSTILLALEFALFGILPGTLEGSALLRHGKDAGNVEVSFELEGKQCLIKRNLKRAKDGVRQDSGYIVFDGQKYEGTATELKARVLELLGYPKELLTKSKSLIYRYTVYTPQEEMRQILSEQSDYRLDTLRKVFQIDKYKRIRENAQLITRGLKEEIREFSARIEGLEERKGRKQEHENQLSIINAELKLLAPKIKDYETKIASKKQEIARAEARIRELNELRKTEEVTGALISEKKAATDTTINEKSQLEAEIVDAKKKTDSMEDVPEQEILKEQEIENRLEQASRQEVEFSELSKRALELDSEIKEKQQRTKDLSSKLSIIQNLESELKAKSRVKEELQILNDEIETITSRLSEYATRKKRAEELMMTISTIDTCPLCLQNVGHSHKEHIRVTESKSMVEAEKEIALLQEKRKGALGKKTAIEAELESLAEKDKELAKTMAELESVNELKKDLETKQILRETFENALSLLRQNLKAKPTEALRNELRTLRERKKVFDEKRQLVKAINDRESQMRAVDKKLITLETEISTLEAALGKIRAGLEGFEDVEADYTALKKALDELNGGERELLIKKASLSKESENLEKNILALDDEISKMLRIKEQMHSTRLFQEWLEKYFTKLMEVMETLVMARVYREFNDYFQAWFRTLIDDETISVRLDDDFSPIIEQNGYETYISNLSGGEKTSCALAYRLALNRTINDMISGIKTKDLIILDEPTDGFSSEQLEKVRDVIKELGMGQVILVSHEPKIESFVDNVIRVRKEEHSSRVSLFS